MLWPTGGGAGDRHQPQPGADGENWESGGDLRTSDGSEVWLFVTDGALSAGKTRLIERGQLLQPRD